MHLPLEIIRDILVQLQVKSLIRFQCVCKEWKHLIESPSFIAEHLQHQQQSTHQNFALLLIEGRFPLTSRLVAHEFPQAPINDSLWDAKILGSCNGLLCVQNHVFNKSQPSFILWNPSTTEVRRVILTNGYFGVFKYDD